MGTPNWKNRTLFHGDNFDVMRAMNSETIDLIATDPPFNKGRDFHATPDSLASGASFQDRWSWEDDVDQDWVDQIGDDWPDVWYVIECARASWGDDMGAFLCFMAVRLIAMHRLLKSTGSIYLHCDPTASHYLKMLMDAIFGRKNFRNEIVWCYTQGGRPRNDFPNKHDLILRYTKSKVFQFHSESIKIPYELVSTKSEDSFTKIDNDGRYYKEVYGTDRKKKYKYYKDEGKVPYDWWIDIPQITGRASKSKNSESTGYPTQKPLALYERIINASSNEGDVVLDPFAGCATTLVACERLERKRQWVGIDIWEKAQDVIVDRLESQGLCAPKYTRKTAKMREQYLFAEEFTFTSELPKRTDDKQVDVPYLKTKNKLKVDEKSDGLTNRQRRDKLLGTKGKVCQGCGRGFDDERYLELDHNTPRADGGSNNLSNRILLCSPCNRLKSHTYTLSGLIRENTKKGYMVDLKLVDALRK